MTEAAPGSAPSAPRVLPWGLLWRIALASALLLAPITYFYGSAFGGVTALVGLVPAFGGQIVGKTRVAYAASAALLVAIGLFTLAPSATLAWAVACALILCAGVEAHETGGRAFVLALYGWCGLALSPSMPPPSEALPFVALGLFWGAAAARVLALRELAAIPPLGRKHSFSLSLFLLAGVIISAQLNLRLSTEYGYWVVLLFVLRALSPPDQGIKKALTYGFGAALGTGFAFMLTLMSLPVLERLGISLVLAFLGLRHLPHPGPWSAAAFTSAILIVLPVGVEGVIVRAEAAAIAVVLTLALIALISLGWSFLWKIADRGATQKLQ